MKYCFLILSALFIVSSCKKTEDKQSYEDMLRDGKWRMDLDLEHGILVEKNKVSPLNEKSIDTLYTLIGKDGDGNLIPDAMLNDTVYNKHYFPECLSDDHLIFREGINGSLNTGELKCPQGEVVETDIQWGFTDNNTIMFLYDAGSILMGNNNVRAEVKEFASDKFVLKYMTIDNLSSIPKKDTTYFTVTFKKK